MQERCIPALPAAFPKAWLAVLTPRGDDITHSVQTICGNPCYIGCKGSAKLCRLSVPRSFGEAGCLFAPVEGGAACPHFVYRVVLQVHGQFRERNC
jgi:hypothetical protein